MKFIDIYNIPHPEYRKYEKFRLKIEETLSNEIYNKYVTININNSILLDHFYNFRYDIEGYIYGFH